jgi:hypothetical protein
MIISATGIPNRLAISLSCEVACIFLPRSVRSKKKYWRVTITTVTPRIKRYWLSKKIGPTLNPWKEKKPGRVCGRGPYAARTPFSKRMEAPIVLMITG